MQRPASIPAIAAALAAVTAAPAAAATSVVERTDHGPVSAAFSYRYQEDRYGSFEFSDLRLRIRHDGVPIYDRDPTGIKACHYGCAPGGYRLRRSVRAVDLNANGHTAVLLDLFTGGAHCCSVTRVYYRDGDRFRSFTHDFADVGYRLRDLGGDGRYEFVSGDPRFDYAFSSYASSYAPVQIWRRDGPRLRTVTSHFRRQVRADARRAWRRYRQALGHDGAEPRGPLAGWAADHYRLEGRRWTLHRLNALAARGATPGAYPVSSQRFVQKLDSRLRRWGYRRR